jgi:hypothetical protein
MPDQLSTPQASETCIKTEYVDKLEELRFKLLSNNKFTVNPLNIIKARSRQLFEEGKFSVVKTKYERLPQARKICLEAYGYVYNICKF